MKFHTLFFLKLGKMLQNLSSAAVVIGAVRVKVHQFTLCGINTINTKILAKILFSYSVTVHRHVVCNVPVSCKANRDRNQLGAWLDSDP